LKNKKVRKINHLYFSIERKKKIPIILKLYFWRRFFYPVISPQGDAYFFEKMPGNYIFIRNIKLAFFQKNKPKTII
jgi:hypothetical protein